MSQYKYPIYEYSEFGSISNLEACLSAGKIAPAGGLLGMDCIYLLVRFTAGDCGLCTGGGRDGVWSGSGGGG